MTEPEPRMSPRAELLIGLAAMVIGVLVLFVVVPVVGVDWLGFVGMVVAVIGGYLVVGVITPKRTKSGTRLQQNDTGPPGDGAERGGG